MKKKTSFIAGYKVLSDSKLIVEMRSGFSKLNCMMKYYESRIEDDDYKMDFDVLIDISEMSFELVVSDMDIYSDQFKSTSKLGKNTNKIAIIAVTPHQKAYSNEINKKFAGVSDHKHFDDIHSALSWLGREDSYDKVIEAIASIKSDPDFICKEEQ